MAVGAQVLSAGSKEPAPGPSRSHPLLITTWNCPYAQRSWIALLAKGVSFDTVFVDLQNKPEWFFKHNEYGRVPTIVWQEDEQIKSLYESLVVNEYINDLPGPALLPEDPADRAAARLLIDQFGVKFSAGWSKILFSADPEANATGVSELNKALNWLEGQASAEGPYLLGREFSLVDAAVIPFLIRVEVAEKLGLYKRPDGLSKLASYQKAALTHPAVAGSISPPDSSRPYLDQLVDTTRARVEKLRAQNK